MAIYTNYGRYLKAKQFKESLELAGDTYMVLGMGDPSWDNNRLSMPIAPYNTSIVSKLDAENNQFFDDKVCQYILSSDCQQALLENGSVVDSNSWVYKYKNLIPAFPCLWKSQSNDDVVLTIGDTQISKNELHLYYIQRNGSLFDLYKVNNNMSTVVENNFDYFSIADDLSREYFSELYLRGLCVDKWLTTPGLIGAVKCKVEFVRDIGFTEDKYTGSINQLYYGDRYWEIVPDSDLASYYDEFNDKYKEGDEDANYPTHLLISAIINPGYLANDLNFDQNLCARQIAIYTSKKSNDEENPTYYRVGEYLFNFGQYCKQQNNSSEWKWTSLYDNQVIDDSDESKVLDFTIPLNIDSNKIYPLSNESKKFNFVLHDYILGNRRDKHSADRISYIVGF